MKKEAPVEVVPSMLCPGRAPLTFYTLITNERQTTNVKEKVIHSTLNLICIIAVVTQHSPGFITKYLLRTFSTEDGIGLLDQQNEALECFKRNMIYRGGPWFKSKHSL